MRDRAQRHPRVAHMMRSYNGTAGFRHRQPTASPRVPSTARDSTGSLMDFEIDYGAFTQAKPRRDTDPLYASVGGRVNSLSNDEIVFYDTATDNAHVMTQQVLQALDLSRSFRTLNEHAERVIEALPQLKGQQAAVRRVLDGLVKRGLMVEGAAFAARFHGEATQDPGSRAQATPELAPFAGLFVRACDRPAQLRRLLETLHERERTHGGGHAVTVVDDSTDPANAREALRGGARELGIGRGSLAAVVLTHVRDPGNAGYFAPGRPRRRRPGRHRQPCPDRERAGEQDHPDPDPVRPEGLGQGGAAAISPRREHHGRRRRGSRQRRPGCRRTTRSIFNTPREQPVSPRVPPSVITTS